MNKNDQLNRIENLLTNYIEYATEKFSTLEESLRKEITEVKEELIEVKEELTEVKTEIKDLGRNQRSMKLDLLDKLASKERVDNHELRIQELESQLA